MQHQDLLSQLAELADEVMLLEPRATFDQALVGIGERFNAVFALYDRRLVVELLGIDDPDEAEEFFLFNTLGAWVGDGTPCFVELTWTTPSAAASAV